MPPCDNEQKLNKVADPQTNQLLSHLNQNIQPTLMVAEKKEETAL